MVTAGRIKPGPGNYAGSEKRKGLFGSRSFSSRSCGSGSFSSHRIAFSSHCFAFSSHCFAFSSHRIAFSGHCVFGDSSGVGFGRRRFFSGRRASNGSNGETSDGDERSKVLLHIISPCRSENPACNDWKHVNL